MMSLRRLQEIIDEVWVRYELSEDSEVDIAMFNTIVIRDVGKDVEIFICVDENRYFVA